MTVRPFAPSDYAGWIAGSNRCYPDYPWSLKEMRHEDETWDHTRFFKRRWVAVDGESVVGGVHLNHRPWRFHADRYAFDIWVVPERRRCGHGTALYDTALATLRERNALAATAGAKESMADGVEFLRKRGWVEVKRDWESRLHVGAFDPAPFATAPERIAGQAIRITTYADELARDPETPRKAHELGEECRQDVPSLDAATPESFEDFQRRWIEHPAFLADAYFIAVGPDGRWLGMSNLERSIDDPTFLWQGLTGVRREARGNGIAMALKLRTIDYARARGIDHIKTWNDTTNRPMLAINEALGFEKQPAWIAFELRLRSQ